MSDYWSQYWQQGHLTSFGESFKGNYQGVLKSLWLDFFKKCSSNSRVLDIATGNGALIDLAIEAKRVDMFYTGIDSATLSISGHLKDQPNIEFVENIKAESLPENLADYDYVISQFGLEYSDLTESIPEFVKKLKPNGQFMFVIHDSESIIVKPNAATLLAAQQLSAPDGALQKLCELIDALDEEGVSGANSEKFRSALNTCIKALADKDENALWATNFPMLLKEVMNPRISLADKNKIIQLFKSELEGQIIRLSDLVGAAHDQTKFSNLVEILQSNGITVSDQKVINESPGNSIARLITGQK